MTITNRLINEDTKEIATSHLRPLSPLYSVETTTVSEQNQDSLEDSSLVVFVQFAVHL
jgi:hypothetical protein